jgi:hypothetical protein
MECEWVFEYKNLAATTTCRNQLSIADSPAKMPSIKLHSALFVLELTINTPWLFQFIDYIRLMNNLTVIVCIVSFGLLILFVWNMTNFRSFKKNSLLSKDYLNDQKYWELKYRLEFVYVLFSFAVGVGIFFGWNTIDGLKKDIRKEFEAQMNTEQAKFTSQVNGINKRLEVVGQSTEAINEKVIKSKTALTKDSISLNSLKNIQDDLFKKNKLSRSDLDVLLSNIAELNKKNKFQLSFYTISRYPLKSSMNGYIRFSDLTTNHGDKLPIFSNIPVVIASPTENEVYEVQEVTTGFRMYINDLREHLPFDPQMHYPSFIIIDVK